MVEKMIRYNISHLPRYKKIFENSLKNEIISSLKSLNIGKKFKPNKNGIISKVPIKNDNDILISNRGIL